MIACYTDRISVAPGERFALHASAAGGDCDLEIARIGGERRIVHRSRVRVGDHPRPAHADAEGCGWPVARTVTVGADWATGYYDIALSGADGSQAHHFVCVRAPSGQPRAKAVLVLATNTLAAYNYWGGASAYAHVESLMARQASLPEAMANAIGRLSTQRPIAPLLIAPPADMPRLVNLSKRGFEQRPWAGADAAWSRAHGQSPYDGSAGFLNKWEHLFVRWAEGHGIGFDYLTDYDLDADPGPLDLYQTVILVGHSEYWSGRERDAIDAFVGRGGRLAIFSGNTAFWKVRWEDDGKTLVCHKWKGFEAEQVEAADATHLWSHPAFRRPEAATTGLSFIFGGYHRLGLCAARGIGGYTVYRDRHWALVGCDLYYGDVFGDQVPLLGYENDGCQLRIGDDGLPAAVGNLGVPEDLEIIAMAPAAFAETPSPYRALIPPEQLDVVAEIAYGDSGPASQARVLRGHAVMASFRCGEGEVFNAGTTEWAHGLAAGDPFVTRITLNVLRRFGAV
ncbi:MAG TPA: N,N-dimethylformamidase beta subunit family domain-containing protein [Caulobacteraceae bacterium]|nr:N,N-dimethylformamidase beta subunit family domain-containing protein [Caulobacteraceae bacterium]